jgi:hypothetical protein
VAGAQIDITNPSLSSKIVVKALRDGLVRLTFSMGASALVALLHHIYGVNSEKTWKKLKVFQCFF